MKKIIKKIFDNKEYLIFSFFIISIISWFGELEYGYLIKHRASFPGVLYGPWCPIYGTAFIFLYIFTKNEKNKFYQIISIFITVILVEYFSSFVCEILFKKVAWDYTNYPLDISGRICLHMSLLFTIIGYIFMYYVEPAIKRIFNKFKNPKYINILFIVLFLIDLTITLISNK